MAKKSESCLSILVKMTFLMTILVIVAVIGIFAAYNKLNEFFNRGGNVIVPDFHGRHLTEVIQMKPRGIEIVTSDKKHDAKIPKDYVIAQFPQPGAVVKSGRQVQLTVSLGAHQVKVPDLIGKAIREVDVALINSQLIVGNRAYVYSSNVPPDRVVSQSPLSQEDYSINSPVDLLISLGVKPESIPLPNLTNIPLETAKQRLKAWGFNIGKIVSKQDEKRAKFRIISTDPAPYSYLRKGDTVNILISSGYDSGSATSAELTMFEIFGRKQSVPQIDMTGFRALNTVKPQNPVVKIGEIESNKIAKTVVPTVNPAEQLKTQAPVVNPAALIATAPVSAPTQTPASIATITAVPIDEKKTSTASNSGISDEDLTEMEGYPIFRASDTVKSKENSEASKTIAVTVPQKEVNYMMPDGFMQKELKIMQISQSGKEQIYVGTHKPLEVVKLKVPIVPNSKLQVYINDVFIDEI